LLRHLAEPPGNVPLVQKLACDDHDQEDSEPADDESDEVSLPERLLLFDDRQGLSVSSLLRCAFTELRRV
jgi:hypothetical protein